MTDRIRRAFDLAAARMHYRSFLKARPLRFRPLMMARPLISVSDTASVAEVSDRLCEASCVVVLNEDGGLFGVIDRMDLSFLVCRALGGVVEATAEYFDWAVDQHQLAKLTARDVVLGNRRDFGRDSFVALDGGSEILAALDAVIAAGADGGSGPRRIIILEDKKPSSVVSMSDFFHEWLAFSARHPELDSELATRPVGTCFDPKTHRPACRVRMDETLGVAVDKMIAASTDVILVVDEGGESLAVITASDLREWSLGVDELTGLVKWTTAFGQLSWKVGDFLKGGYSKRMRDIRAGAIETPVANAAALVSVRSEEPFKVVMALMEANHIHHIVIKGVESAVGSKEDMHACNTDIVVGSKDFVAFFAQNPARDD